jgi:hypothetical protein
MKQHEKYCRILNSVYQKTGEIVPLVRLETGDVVKDLNELSMLVEFWRKEVKYWRKRTVDAERTLEASKKEKQVKHTLFDKIDELFVAMKFWKKKAILAESSLEASKKEIPYKNKTIEWSAQANIWLADLARAAQCAGGVVTLDGLKSLSLSEIAEIAGRNNIRSFYRRAISGKTQDIIENSVRKGSREIREYLIMEEILDKQTKEIIPLA